MFSSKLNKLRNQYKTALGKIERDFELAPQSQPEPPTSKKWVKYKLEVQTLFNGYQTFLTANERDLEKEYLDFFGDVTAKGAPEEAMIGAAALVECKQDELKNNASVSSIEKHCDAWNTNIHLSLQFAVIEYLTDMSQLGREAWHHIIKNLLKLNADPNYPTTKFKFMLNQYKWTLPITELNSSFEILISANEITDDVRKLAIDFAAQQEKVKSKLTMTSEQAMRIFPKINPAETFCGNPWFQWLEVNFPDKVKEYLLSQKQSMIPNLAKNKDFKSIDHFKNHYGIEPFTFLIELEEKETSEICTSSPIFQYLENTAKEQLLQYIKKNHNQFIHRFKLRAIVNERKFERINLLKVRYGIDPFDTLIDPENPHISWVNDPGFQYLETIDLDRLKKYIHQNWIALPRFCLEKFAAYNDFKTIDQYREQYNLNVFNTLMSLQMSYLDTRKSNGAWTKTSLFRYLNETFPLELLEYLKSYNEKIRKGLVDSEDYHALKELYNQKLISLPISDIMEKIGSDVRICLNKKHVSHDSFENYDGVNSKNMCDEQMFKWLSEINSDAIGDYFRSPHFLNEAKHHGKPYYLLRNYQALSHLAYQYNIDPNFFYINELNIASNEAFNLYYKERAKWVLDFISKQSFPIAAANYKGLKLIGRDKMGKEFKHNGKNVIVSPTLYTVVEKLIQINNPSESKNDNKTLLPDEIFFKINASSAALLKTTDEKDKSSKKNDAEVKNAKRDDAEHQIYVALASVLTDNSLLSQYVKREFDIKHRCTPVLKALKSRNVFLSDNLRRKIFFDFLGLPSKRKKIPEAKEDDMVVSVKFH